jgi:Zn-dependent protease
MARDDHEPLTAPDPVTAPEPATLPSGHERPSTSLIGRVLGLVVVIGGALLKFGLFSLKFFGIFLAVGGYALIWGLPFAVGFVLLILAHEMGHYIEARRLGLDPALPVFIPFLGAYVALRNVPFDPWRNARVSLAGPVAGGAAAYGVLVAGELGDSRLLLALAYTAFLLNLINLAPVWIFDGHHVYRAWQVLRRGGGRPDPAEAMRLGWIVAAASLVTIGLLVLGMITAHVPQSRL